MKPPASQTTFLTDTAPTTNPDRDLVFDALAFSQAPLTANQLIDLLVAANCRTTRGAAFHNAEVRRLLDELAEHKLATRDDRGRWSAPREAGWQRFRALVQDDTRREFWWQAWRKRHHFDRGWGLDIFDSATCAAAMRIVIHCGRSAETFNHFATMVGPSAFGAAAFRQALLDPFDTELLGQLDVGFVCGLADTLLATVGDDANVDVAGLLDWLLTHARSTPKKVPDHLHYRLAQTLLFREQFSAARELLTRLETPESQAIGAGIDIVEGRFADGSARFEAALKALAAETGRRKNLLPPSMCWLYTMALLAQPEPAVWAKARKFAAAESGKREAQPYTFWGLWQSCDRPAPGRFAARRQAVPARARRQRTATPR